MSPDIVVFLISNPGREDCWSSKVEAADDRVVLIIF
jgi:hypothetical protein